LIKEEEINKTLEKLGIKYYIPQQLLPLFILKLLSKQSMHGYQLTEEIEKLTCVKVPRQIIYFVLKKYESAKLVEAKWIVKDGAKPKKIYSITKTGLAFLTNRLAYVKKLLAILETI